MCDLAVQKPHNKIAINFIYRTDNNMIVIGCICDAGIESKAGASAANLVTEPNQKYGNLRVFGKLLLHCIECWRKKWFYFVIISVKKGYGLR